MLILTRKPGEALFIGDKIKVVVVEIKGNQIRLGIEAPSDVRILREEIYSQILEENKSAAAPVSGDSLAGLSAVMSTTDSSTSSDKPVLKSARGLVAATRPNNSNHGGKKK